MSQAEELLKSMLTHTHTVIDTDARYVIDPITKQVTNTSDKITIMQGDHNSERLTFEIPRYVDGHDMALCNATKIHYINIESGTENQYADIYDVDDLQVDPENSSVVVCSWLISRYATQLVGPLAFIIQYACADDNGDLVYEWHTDINQDNEIKKTINNGEASVLEYTDLLEQWRQRLFGAGDSVIANITAEGEAQVTAVNAAGATQKDAIARKGEETLSTIPPEYTEVYNIADEARRTKADAIVLNEEGELIFVDDSSNDFIKNLKLFGKTEQVAMTGKNLLKLNVESHDFNSGAAVYSTHDDGTVHAKGTVVESGCWHGSTYQGTIELHANTEYIISGMHEYVKYQLEAQLSDGSEWKIYDALSHKDIRFASPEDLVATFRVVVYEGAIYDVIAYPMIRLASIEDPTWEPYTGGVPAPNPDCPQELVSVENPVVSVFNKNIADLAVHSSDSNYAALVTTTDLSSIKSGKTYTLSVWLDSEVDSRAYWNSAAKVLKHLEFDVRAGLHRYVYTFAAAEDGANYTTPVNILNKYPTDDGKRITTSMAQIEEGAEATEYTPFNRQSVAIAYTLPGIPVSQNGNYTDANGQQWICDEIDFERGVYVQRIGSKTFDGSDDEIWYAEMGLANTVMFRIEIPDSTNVGNFVGNDFRCTHFRVGQFYNVDLIGAQHTMRQFYFRLANSTLNTIDLTGWKAWLAENPATVQYILATPIETPLTEEEIATFRKLKTNYHNTTVLNDAGAHMELDYIADTTIYIRDNQPYISDERVQAAVDAWLEAHYPTAEGVSF